MKSYNNLAQRVYSFICSNVVNISDACYVNQRILKKYYAWLIYETIQIKQQQ